MSLDIIIRNLQDARSDVRDMTRAISVPRATRCLKCSFFNGSAWLCCPLCKTVTPEFEAVRAMSEVRK